MSVLVYINNYGGKIQKNSFEALAYGKALADKLNTNVVAAMLGPAENPSELGAYGASEVFHNPSASFADHDPGAITKALSGMIEQSGAAVVIFSHDYTGKSIAPRVAARLKAGLVTGAIALPDTSGTFSVKKAVFSGKAFADIEILSDKKVISLLPNSFEYSKGEGSATVTPVNGEAEKSTLKVKEIKKESTKLSLTEAEIVVSAGRGLKGPENWGMIEELANDLGAATACSRPVADIGWRPHHEHVGQTGIAIRPNLYFAIGISGAIQHLAGVNGSKVIVVINTDPEAPFFKAADYGIIGDAFEVVPKLVTAAKALRA
ncbi:MAG: electron transfer flavoprotein subunit alpha/FixB family protein [Vicingaceae bacterium]